MNNTDIIYRSIDVIEENLKNNISVFDLSEQFGFSFYYFSRLFKGITGYSPKTYMLNRKVTESVGDILNSDKKIIEIAFDYGFNTPESFSRAFQKIIGVNPSDLRKQNSIDKERLFYPLSRENTARNTIIEGHEPELVEFGPVPLIGISVYDETFRINDLSRPWQRLINNVSKIPKRIIPEKYYQVQSWFSDQDDEAISFFIAAEVSDTNDIPMHFSAKILPKQEYLKFLHKGLSNKVGLTYQYIYEKWLPGTEYKLPYLFNFEHYGELFTDPYDENSVSEIYIPVKL